MVQKHNWPKILEDFAQSQLSAYTYAKRNNISRTTFYKKLKTQQKSNSQVTQQKTPKLILLEDKVHEINLNSHQPAPNNSPQLKPLLFRMNLGPAELEFHDLPNPQWFAEVIKCF